MKKEKSTLIEHYRNRKLVKASDIIILSIILILIISFIFILPRHKGGSKVEVYENGKLIHSVSLHKDQVIKIEGKLDIHIEKGFVYIKNSTCPDKLCQKHKINKVGGQLICLPNKIIVKIVGNAKVDVISR